MLNKYSNPHEIKKKWEKNNQTIPVLFFVYPLPKHFWHIEGEDCPIGNTKPVLIRVGRKRFISWVCNKINFNPSIFYPMPQYLKMLKWAKL